MDSGSGNFPATCSSSQQGAFKEHQSWVCLSALRGQPLTNGADISSQAPGTAWFPQLPRQTPPLDRSLSNCSPAGMPRGQSCWAQALGLLGDQGGGLGGLRRSLSKALQREAGWVREPSWGTATVFITFPALDAVSRRSGPGIFLIHGWLNLWMWSPGIMETDCICKAQRWEGTNL